LRAPGRTTGPSTFTPTLFAPGLRRRLGYPPSVVIGSNPPDIQLYATSGTAAPAGELQRIRLDERALQQGLNAYANLVCSSGTSFSNYATVSSSPASGATTITVTATSSPTAGACPLTLWDGLTSV